MESLEDVSIECIRPVVIEDVVAKTHSEHTSELILKKDFGNARLVSGDAMLWVANSKMTTRPAVHEDLSNLREVRVANGSRAFVFVVGMNEAAEAFLSVLRDQVEGKAGLEIKRKKRKIRKKLAENQAAGFVPMLNQLKSPTKTVPLTPTKSKPRLTDATNSPRLASPLPLCVSTVSDAYVNAAMPSPSKSPYKSPFRKKPAPRIASPITSLPPKSPSSGSGLSSASPKPRQWLSPSRHSPVRLRAEFTPPSLRRDGGRTPETDRMSVDGKENNAQEPRGGRGIVNKRVRSLQRMLDEVPKEDTERVRGSQTPVRSPYFPSPTLRPASVENTTPPLVPRLLGLRESNVTSKNSPSQNHENAVTPGSTSSGTTHDEVRKVTHGLLNLGNYCYMNAIIQSLAAIPEFASHLRDSDGLVAAIEKFAATKGIEVNDDELRDALKTWRDQNNSRTAIEDNLALLLQRVVEGSETSINPEPLKAVMGRKNPRFATHRQQDAHEFLLELVNEYEKELVAAAEAVVTPLLTTDVTEQNAEPTPSPPKRSSLLNFFRKESPSKSSPPAKKPNTLTSEFAADLSPAKCFRAELWRTLTCRSCEYSRRQIETYYDFSLDLPSQEASQHEKTTPSAPPQQQCHCGLTAIIQKSGAASYFTCPKATCSLREETKRDAVDVSLTDIKLPVEGQDVQQAGNKSGPLMMADLLTEQFKPAVLQLKCEKCSTGTEAIAGYDVKSLPQVLVLHLKRFEVNPHTGTLFKRCDTVEAPLDLIPATNICAGEELSESQRYRLRSVVHHIGKTVDEGHYVADVRGFGGEWRRRNDTHETVIGEDFALRASRSQESCYMFFYVCDPDLTPGQEEKENFVPVEAPDQQVRDSSQEPHMPRQTPQPSPGSASRSLHLL